MEEQNVKIAVLETKIEGLREQHKAQSDKIFDMLQHQNETVNSRFTELSKYITPAVEFAVANKEIPERVSILWDFHNQNKGFLSATRLITGAAGGAIGAGITYLLGMHK